MECEPRAADTNIDSSLLTSTVEAVVCANRQFLRDPGQVAGIELGLLPLTCNEKRSNVLRRDRGVSNESVAYTSCSKLHPIFKVELETTRI